MPNAELT